jgi:hypothetical protein
MQSQAKQRKDKMKSFARARDGEVEVGACLTPQRQELPLVETQLVGRTTCQELEHE